MKIKVIATLHDGAEVSGWLTTEHAASSYGQPVFADDDNQVYDWINIANISGDEVEPEESLQALAQDAGIPYDTLYKAAYDGRLVARKSGNTWLSTKTAVEYAIKKGKIRKP